MATRINGGVRLVENGVPIPTKQRLKDIIKGGLAHQLEFYSTSDMGQQFNGPISRLIPDVMLDIVGPDPYTKRNWYASIALDANGQPRVVN